MFIKFDDFINESNKNFVNKFMSKIDKTENSVNEAFLTKDLERVLSLTAKYIGKYTKSKISMAKAEEVNSRTSPKPYIAYKYYLEDGRAFRLNWLVGQTSGTMYSFSIYTAFNYERPVLEVVIPSGFGIGMILPTIVKALRDPKKDITIQDFVNAASMRGNIQESFGYDMFESSDFTDFEIDEYSDEVITYTIDESIETESINEAYKSQLSDEEIARRDELTGRGKKGRTPEETAEMEFLKAASSYKALWVYEFDELIEELRTNQNGVWFRYIKKDGSSRLAHGTTNHELIIQDGGTPPKVKDSEDTKFDGEKITKTVAKNSPYVNYWDLGKHNWGQFERGKLVAKQTKTPSKPVKTRTTTAEERQRRDYLNSLGKKRRTPAEEAELQNLLAKQRGLDTFVTEKDIIVKNIRPKHDEVDLLTLQKMEAVDKIVNAMKFSGDEQFDAIERNVLLMAKAKRTALLITGQAGVGKTYTVTKTLESVGVEKGSGYVHIKGKATAVAIYEALYRYKDRIVIFDDCDSAFADPDAVNILKGALDTSKVREISWYNSKNFVVDDMTQAEIQAKHDESVENGKPMYPQAFEYSGRVIFISNIPIQKFATNDKLKSLLSRSLALDVSLSPTEMRSRLIKILPKIEPEYSMEIKNGVVELLDKYLAAGIVSMIDFRSFIKALPTYESCMSFSEQVRYRIVYNEAFKTYETD